MTYSPLQFRCSVTKNLSFFDFSLYSYALNSSVPYTATNTNQVWTSVKLLSRRVFARDEWGGLATTLVVLANYLRLTAASKSNFRASFGLDLISATARESLSRTNCWLLSHPSHPHLFLGLFSQKDRGEDIYLSLIHI